MRQRVLPMALQHMNVLGPAKCRQWRDESSSIGRCCENRKRIQTSFVHMTFPRKTKDEPCKQNSSIWRCCDTQTHMRERSLYMALQHINVVGSCRHRQGREESSSIGRCCENRKLVHTSFDHMTFPRKTEYELRKQHSSIWRCWNT